MDFLYQLQCIRESSPEIINYIFVIISEFAVTVGPAIPLIIFLVVDKKRASRIIFTFADYQIPEKKSTKIMIAIIAVIIFAVVYLGLGSLLSKVFGHGIGAFLKRICYSTDFRDSAMSILLIFLLSTRSVKIAQKSTNTQAMAILTGFTRILKETMSMLTWLITYQCNRSPAGIPTAIPIIERIRFSLNT